MSKKTEDEFLTAEKVAAFMEGAAKLRQSDGKLPPDAVAVKSAQELGIGSCARQLVLAALRIELACDRRDPEKIAFLTSAAAALCRRNGCYEIGWLEDFNKMLMDGIETDIAMPSPETLQLDVETRETFLDMLKCALAFAESKGKVGKRKLDKSPAYKAVKLWMGFDGWHGGAAGFSEADRNLLQEIADLSRKMAGREPDANSQHEECQSAEEQLDEARRTCSRLAEERDSEANRAKALADRLCRAEEDLRIRDAELEDARRQNGVLENHERTLVANIENGVGASRRQFEASKGSLMTIELGAAMREHLGRIFDVLSENGIRT